MTNSDPPADASASEPIPALRLSLTLRFLIVTLLALAIALRVLWPQSDAYARLSWSSALVTDEGFYCHHARSLVLFGHPPADQFDNALIMPLLHGVQVLTFRLFGVGLVQARGISIGCSLLTLALFFAACRRAFGTRVAAVALLLLALDHVNLLYNRLALMDTPAQLPLVAAFYAFVRGQGAGSREQGRNLTQRRRDAERGDREQGRRGEGSHRGTKAQRDTRKEGSDAFLFSRWSVVCGVCLIAAYAVRGLSALLAPVPLLILWQEARREVSRRDAETPREGTGKRASSLASFSFSSVAASLRFCVRLLPGPLLVGLAVGGGVYLLAWYLPHHAELSRVNHYYLFSQLIPKSSTLLQEDVTEGLLGAGRGLVSYLVRHTPVQFAMALLALPVVWDRKALQSRETDEANGDVFRAGGRYMAWWLLIFCALLLVIRYAPSRYYVLFYPALAALAAIGWDRLYRAVSANLLPRWFLGLIGALFGYHIVQTILLHLLPASLEPLAFQIAQVTGIGIGLALYAKSFVLERLMMRQGRRLAMGFLTLWSVINIGWTMDWLAHRTYQQRDAMRWLSTHLPPGSVMLGAVATGLAVDTPFQAVNIIQGLSNDDHPVEKFAPAPRYIVIIDSKGWKEVWWSKHYPNLTAPERAIYRFPLLRPFFTIGVYPVPTAGETGWTNDAKNAPTARQ